MVIHYLWVGPPTKTDPSAIAGHDIAGPIQMAQQLQKQKKDGDTSTPAIKFWCLKEHEEFYRNQFRMNGAEIEVCSIEGLLEKESKEKLAELAERSKYVSDFMKKQLDGSKHSLVQFKDLFSLFLLLSQGGYFFDTNVFPIKQSDVHLTAGDQPATACGPGRTNDFYLMYSPTRNNSGFQGVFMKWRLRPAFANLNAFEGCDLSIMNPNSIESMGIKKVSYKSYFNLPNAAKGLFFWIGRPPGLAEYLKYGDMNQTMDNNPTSITVVEQCNLCTVNGPLEKKALLDMNFNTNEAYVCVVSGDKAELFYINKKNNICELIPNPTRFIPSFFPQVGEKKSATVEDIVLLQDDLFRKNFTNYRHSMIANTKNQTLLHQAVMMKDMDAVRLLIDCGANANDKATYQIYPNGPTLELTPLELAKYLKLEEIANLFEPEAIALGQKKREIDKLIGDFSEKISAIKSHPSPRAQKKATELLESLRAAQARYNAVKATDSKDGQIQASNQFKRDCSKAIRDAKPILENDLGWGDYLSNLLKKLVNRVMSKVFSNPKGLGFFQTLHSESSKAAENLEDKLNQSQLGSKG